ncbi:hypothetical protein [Microvirga brassicacearum]|uniref:Uncharacterized protein n=1 Tax=Microvirga brassicacearum TaxID=2580413 RepID=A0A5N3P386_9HYPH|nr:hypothetical protein [Microvirga brassicacearum]KAB0264189.1 hypothetical protein FEZ63_24425 [Microvirga brassicacearum]
MSRHLTDNDVALAVNVVTDWHAPITWDALVAVLSTVLGRRITRQAIYKSHPRIVDAFRDAKARARNNRQSRKIKGKVKKHGDIALAYQIDQTENLRAQIELLKRENHNLLEQFLRWQYNAASRGVTREILDIPLPKRKQ